MTTSDPGHPPSWSHATRHIDLPPSGPAAERQIVLAFPDGKPTVTIGRAEGNDVILDDPGVSRVHARIDRVGDRYRITDLGSTNGTYVNGEAVRARELRDGDEVWIAGRALRFDRAGLTRYARGGGVQVDAVGLRRVVGRGTVLLDDVSLSIYPGEFVAVVGGSGAGKTTLLNALAGVAPPTGGRVLYNGAEQARCFAAFRQALGYVPQDDIVHPELSVERTLRYAARLRLPEDTSAAEVERRVRTVLERLELAGRAGTEVRRLSGGQRKRVSIGVELLTEPEAFFLDEPTSGLDPGLDGRMMELLRGLADQGRTVVLTTHATRNVMACDQVAFMARGGHLAYYGPPSEAAGYFGVGDFVEIYQQLEGEGAPERAAAAYRASDHHRRLVRLRLAVSPDAPPSPTDPAQPAASSRGPRVNWLRQFFWLSARFLDILRRDPVAIGVLLATAPITGLMLGSTFSQDVFALTWDEGGHAREALALLFMLIISSIFIGGFVAARAIAEELPIYLRERLVNLRIVPYVLSKLLVLGLFAPIQSALLVGLVAWRVEIPGGEQALWELYGVILMTNLVAIAMGLFASAVASNGLQATLILVVLIIPQLAVSGSIVPLSILDNFARALSLLMLGRWSLSLLGHAVDINARLNAQYPKNDFADQFTVDPSTCLLALGGLFAACMLGAVLALRRRDAR